jgi:hypothetical protein
MSSKKHFSVYDSTTGALVGQDVIGTAANVALNTPEGCAAIEGQHDHLSKRVDLATGEVVDWVPPKPDDTELETYEWDTTTAPKRPRWVAKPTALARKQAKQARVQERMDRLEAKQARPLRELLLDPNNAQARDKLAALEAQLVELRVEFANPP